MKIGVRAHDYGKRSAEELAGLLRAEGYDAAQLAIPKAIAGIESYEAITPAKIEEIRTAFEKNNIVIPVFGCYMDLANPDADIRKKAVSTIARCLPLAKELGAQVLGTETAYAHLSMAERRAWKPYMMDSIARVMEEAVRIDIKFAIEPVWWHPLTDVETTLEVLDYIGDESHLRLIFDASNLLENPACDQTAHWNMWLTAVGDRIDVLHIKDYCLDEAGVYQPMRLGTGILSYDPIRAWLKRQERARYLLREEMNLVFAKEDIAFMKDLF